MADINRNNRSGLFLRVSDTLCNNKQSVSRMINHWCLTFGLAVSCCDIHGVVLVAVAGKAVIHVNAQLVTHILLQALINLWMTQQTL